jgi:hypothetical protein
MEGRGTPVIRWATGCRAAAGSAGLEMLFQLERGTRIMLQPIIRATPARQALAFAAGWVVIGVWLGYGTRHSLQSDIVPVLALSFIGLLAAAFACLGVKGINDSTLEFVEGGFRIRRGSWPCQWRWDDVTAFAVTPRYYMLEVLDGLVEISRSSFLNGDQVAEEIRRGVGSATSHAGSAGVRLRSRIRFRQIGFLAIPPASLGFMPLYADFAARLVADCGVSATRASSARMGVLAFLLVMFVIGRLWIDSPGLAIAVFAGTLYLVGIAALHLPLYLNATTWLVMALVVPVLALGSIILLRRRAREIQY